MTRIQLGLTALAFALAAAPLVAQEAAQEAVPLTVDRVHEDSLAADETDAFTLELAADRFVLGEVDQRSVDVVVTVTGPDGQRVSRVDFTARGPELFQFDAEGAGEYRIEVSPFEGETGRYALVIRRDEAIATDPEARVDQLMATYDGPVPGGYIGVVEDGELVFAKAYGMADLAYDIPFDLDTRNNIGSTSKQFTAFAILLLAERGELSLDDDIRTHVPELPDFGDTVRIRHLLTHTSGYREFINALALAGRRVDEGDFIGRFEVLDLLERQPELQNEPGAEFNYNNSGFSLLTLVVERVTDTPFPDWMRENVFEPLGMEHTLVKAHPGQIVEHGSRGYVPADESASGWREGRDLGASMGAGGIYSTVGDLAQWMANFESHRVGPADAFQAMTTRYVLTTGDTTDYGLGLFVDEYRGLPRVHHGGADMAHRSMIQYFPTLNAGVIAQSNNATFNSAAIASGVARAFFGEHMELEEEEEAVGDGAPFDPADYDVADFEPLEGRYALDEAPQFVLSFFVEDDTLWTQATGQPKARIEPVSDSTFRLLVVDASVTFHRNPDGTADSLTLHQNGEHLARKLEGEKWEPAPEDLDAYTGRFFSQELQTVYDVAVEDSTLVIRHRRFEEPVELSPGDEPDHFTGGFPIATAEFVRDEDGDVIAVLVGNGRTRDVRFERVEDGL